MPDARHFHDQKYCKKAACRIASARASRARWNKSEKGAEYRDPEENKRRVREWRKANPRYWKRKGTKRPDALQDTTPPEVTDSQGDTTSLNANALQDSMIMQPALLVGLMSILTGSALQETIAETTRHLVFLGQNILGKCPGREQEGERKDDYCKTNSVS